MLAQYVELGIDRPDWPQAFGLSREAFAAIADDRVTAPRYVESLARAAYKLPAAPFVIVFGPVIAGAVLFGLAIMLVLQVAR